MHVYIRLLGSLELEFDGAPVELAGLRERRLLAALALNANQVVSADTLIEALWEEPPPTARQQIYNVVALLRRVLKPAASDIEISAVGGGYRLRIPHGDVDLHRFSELVKAAQTVAQAGGAAAAIASLEAATLTWRGPALDGLGSRYFENIAVQLNAERLHTMERLVRHRLRSGATAELVSELYGLVAQYPFHESFRAHLMAALIGSGRRAEALAEFDNARRELADELGLDPGPELLKMQRLALDQPAERPPVENPPESEPDSQAPAADARIPPDDRTSAFEPCCTLPGDAADFTARSSEISLVHTSLESDSALTMKMIALYGMGGAGKTTLAVHVAHRLGDDYPDGRFFVDLQGFTAGAQPVSSGQALAVLLRDSGVPADQIPPDAQQRESLWRARIRGRRVLVVLDNAVDEAQVRPLLPNGGGSAAIVTSRRRLPSLAGAALTLDSMGMDEACELFTRIAGETRVAGQREAIADVVDVCGRLPLAIRIAAVLFRDRSAWSAAYLARKLRQQGKQANLLDAFGRQVRGVASLSCAHLSPVQRAVFRTLGATPCTDFDAYGVAALTDLTVFEAESCLEALLDESLLIQRIEGRYQFHDIIRDYARELWEREGSGDEADDVFSRLLDYYLCLVSRLCRPLASRPYQYEPTLRTGWKQVPEQDDIGDGSDLLSLEYANIVAVAELAALRERHAENSELICLFQPYLKLINFAGEAEPLLERALDSARIAGDTRGAGLSLFGLARIAMLHQDLDRAQRRLTDALALSREAGDEASELHQLIFLGTLLYERLLPLEACEQLELARALPAAERDVVARAAINNNLGLMYRDVGRYESALEKFTEALACYARSPSIQSASAWTNIGLEHLRRGAYDEAEQAIGEGLRSSESARFPYAQVYALLSLAELERARHRDATSIAYCERSLEIAREYGFEQMEYEALISLGDTLLAKDLDSAEDYYRKAQAKCIDHALRRTRASAMEGLAHVALARGDAEVARAHWKNALDIYPEYLPESAAVQRHLEAVDEAVDTEPREIDGCRRCR